MELSSLVAELCEIPLSRISNRAEERVSSTNTRQSNSSIDDAIALGVMCSFFLFGCLMEKCFVAYLVYGQSKSAAIARPLFAEIPPAAAAIVCHAKSRRLMPVDFVADWQNTANLALWPCENPPTFQAMQIRRHPQKVARAQSISHLRRTKQ